MLGPLLTVVLAPACADDANIEASDASSVTDATDGQTDSTTGDACAETCDGSDGATPDVKADAEVWPAAGMVAMFVVSGT